MEKTRLTMEITEMDSKEAQQNIEFIRRVLSLVKDIAQANKTTLQILRDNKQSALNRSMHCGRVDALQAVLEYLDGDDTRMQCLKRGE